MLGILLTFIYVVVSVFLILVVLLQTGKRADLAGAFGGGGSQTAFGARGAATLLTKATTIAAVLFMITALALSILHSRQGSSRGTVLDEVQEPAPSAPAEAGAPPATTDQPVPPPAEPTPDSGAADREPVPEAP